MSKKNALPVVRTPAQKAAATRAEKQALEKANAQRLAQVVNLMISGHSLAEIGAAIGATPEEVDRMLLNDMSRYVKTQPALRVFVRNFLSAKYTKLLETNWDIATDVSHVEHLDHQDRVLKTLKDMGRLHGAEAPVQTEIKVETAPEAVEKLVEVISKAQGLGYDTSVFDVVDAEVVHDSVEEAETALADASEVVGEGDEEAL